MPLGCIQSETRDILREILPSGTKVALLDFPNHKNAGDHLIWNGELAYIHELDLKLSYMADATRYNKLDLDHFIGKDGVVLVHGGGNFGDRWHEAQAFHERIIAENRGRRIVQLSQGIEFSEGPKLERAQRIYSSHPDLVLLIRDHLGHEEAMRLFPDNDVRYCPDMAFGNRLAPETTDAADVIYLRRTDSEAIAGSAVSIDSGVSYVEDDWGLSRSGELAWMLLHIPGAVARRVDFLRRPLYPVQKYCYKAIADLNLKSAKNILRRGNIVLTDRLHAAVMGALVGKQVVAMDNANGKVAAIYNDYLGSLPNVKFAKDSIEANRIINELINRNES